MFGGVTNAYKGTFVNLGSLLKTLYLKCNVEDKENEICGSSRGEGQFISDLCGGVFPTYQLTTVEGEGGGCGEGVYPSYYQ